MLRPRAPRAVSLLVVSGLLFAACGGKAPAQAAQEALDAGLQAHFAGDLETAKTRYAECLRAEPANKLCLYNDGVIAQGEGRTAEAEASYRLALAQDPGYGPALYNLGLLITPTVPDEAISVLRRYLEVNPDDPAGHLNLGIVLRNQGDAAGAEEQFARVRELDPTMAIPEPAAG